MFFVSLAVLSVLHWLRFRDFFLCVSVLLLLLVWFPLALLCLLFREFCFVLDCSVEHCFCPLCPCDRLMLGHSGVFIFHFPDGLYLSLPYVLVYSWI